MQPPTKHALLIGDPNVLPQTVEERLERGDILLFPQSPFELPREEDLDFLRQQELQPFTHKNISFNPHTDGVSGYVTTRDDEQTERLRRIFSAFSQSVSTWVQGFLTSYEPGIEIDRASFRPLEEATRRIRLTARNDLLHIDAFPNRPAFGRRILRVFANINPTEPRIWMSSYPFDELLARYGHEVGSLPTGSEGWLRNLRKQVFKLFQIPSGERSAYDEFMVRFHNYLKRCDHLQEHGTKRIWTFPPGCVWMAMTDGFAHSVLRGRYALEHSFFVNSEVLSAPDQAPAAYLARASSSNPSERAA